MRLASRMPLTEIGRLDKVWRWRLCHFPRVYVVDKQRVNKSFTTTTILGVIFGLICYFRNEGDFKLSRNMADWTSDANEALVLSLGRHSHPVWYNGTQFPDYLVRSKTDADALTKSEKYDEFNPTFTYPVSVLRIHLVPNLSFFYSGRYMVKKRRFMDIEISSLT